MNHTRREQVRFERFLRLAEEFDLSLGDGLEDVIKEALPAGRKIDPRGARAFSMHYGFDHHDIRELRSIAKDFNIHLSSARFVIRSFESLLKEIARAGFNERKMPGAHEVWPLEDYFTVARGLECELDRQLAARIRTIAGREKVEFRLVGDFCRLSKEDVVRIPSAGIAIANGMEKMLGMAGLSFGLDIPRMKKAA
jgi:hypothetical protein